jgi:hypothetical protein
MEKFKKFLWKILVYGLGIFGLIIFFGISGMISESGIGMPLAIFSLIIYLLWWLYKTFKNKDKV